MPRFSRSRFKLANQTLRLVEKRIPRRTVARYWLEAYQNGRETGYAICCGRFTVTFAEHRNSDDVVVHVGNHLMGGNIPDEEAYKNKHFFRTPAQAAKYILAVLK